MKPRKSKYDSLRILEVLQDLHSKTSSGKSLKNYSSFCVEHRITKHLFTVLIKNGILINLKEVRKKGPSEYVWNTITPNVHMSNKLISAIYNYHVKLNSNFKNKKNQAPILSSSENSKENLFCAPIVHDANNSKLYQISSEIENKSVSYITSKKDSSQNTTASSMPYYQSQTSLPVNSTFLNKNQRKISVFWGLILIQW